ncbi:Unconventional myosin-Ie, partial [Dissostichus eleginoides]
RGTPTGSLCPLGVHVPPPPPNPQKDGGGRDINIPFNRAPASASKPPPLQGTGATEHSSPTLMRGDRIGRFTRPLQWSGGPQPEQT